MLNDIDIPKDIDLRNLNEMYLHWFIRLPESELLFVDSRRLVYGFKAPLNTSTPGTNMFPLAAKVRTFLQVFSPLNESAFLCVIILMHPVRNTVSFVFSER